MTFAQTKRDSIEKLLSSVSSPLKKLHVVEIAPYVDSINNYRDSLPRFLLNPCFDWNASLWEDAHSPISLRWEILSKVTNMKALETIILQKDKRLKLHCSHSSDKVYPYLAMPMIDQSFYQLIRKRYQQLKQSG